MRGEDSPLVWLLLAGVLSAAGAGMAVLSDDRLFTGIGIALLAVCGPWAAASVIAIGVTMGLLRHDHIKAQR